MVKGLLTLIVVLVLAAGWSTAAEAHEPCGCRAAFVAPTCHASASCARSPFRITRLRTITISSSSTSSEQTSPVIGYGWLRRPIRQASPCGMY